MLTSRAREERRIWSIGSSLVSLTLPPKDPDNDDDEDEEDDEDEGEAEPPVVRERRLPTTRRWVSRPVVAVGITCWSTERRLPCWRTLKIGEGVSLMALYELRTYTLCVGKMAEATKLYQELGFPALKKGGHDKKLVGYFQADTGIINQLVHLWKFDDDADRRKHWAGVFADKDFVEGFASKFRPLVMTQEVKLLTAAPWGPHP
jgi:hypothetical protein